MTPIKSTTRKTLTYSRRNVDKGYTDQYLDVDLSTGTIATGPIEEKIKKIFIGGKGFDLWLLWDALKGDNKWSDPQNAICIASGPMGGTPAYPGSGKSIVTSISPAYRFGDRFQRGRLFRSVSEVFRFRCASDHRKNQRGYGGCHRRHRREDRHPSDPGIA